MIQARALIAVLAKPGLADAAKTVEFAAYFAVIRADCGASARMVCIG
jgi:hypothetical protein